MITIQKRRVIDIQYMLLNRLSIRVIVELGRVLCN